MTIEGLIAAIGLALPALDLDIQSEAIIKHKNNRQSLQRLRLFFK